jgi:hypothetical protein
VPNRFLPESFRLPNESRIPPVFSLASALSLGGLTMGVPASTPDMEKHPERL